MPSVEDAADEAEEAGTGEDESKGKPTDGVAFGCIQNSLTFDFGAGGFKEFGVVYVGGAGGGAGEAAEAVIHFLAEGFGDFEVAVGDGTHEGDASARAVLFELGLFVGRAGGQAHAAVHALLENGVVEANEEVR